MTDQRQTALDYAHQHKTDFLQTLQELVALPSVSTDEQHNLDMQRTAEWVATHLKQLGIVNVRIMPTEGHPVVYGEWSELPDKPVVLIYGHYDVQPVDPIELWRTGPFTPTIVGENLYGRGVSDMKGQVMATLNALEAIAHAGTFPVNLKFLIEGEEEIGSPSLGKFIEENKDLLKSDMCLNTDAGLIGKDFPTITFGLRGLAYFELRVYGPDHDLHSGLAGGVVHNPAQALAELIAAMHDQNGRIMLPDFYDSVRVLTKEERDDFARLPTTDDDYLDQMGVKELWGESEYSASERIGARPTLEINGMNSGFTGKGQKTVLPAWAMAKISCRLVPDQDPKVVFEQLQRFLTEKAPKTIRWELEKLSGAPASITDLDQPGVKAIAAALYSVWGVRPFYRREGGSIPVVSQMQTILKIESVLTGFGLPDDNLHAPNEKLHLPTWYRGIDTLIHFFLNI